MILELPLRLIERVADRDVEVQLNFPIGGLATDDDLSAGRRHPDADPKLSRHVAVMMRFDDDSTRGDAALKSLERDRSLPNASFERARRIHASESDLKRNVHFRPRSQARVVGFG